MFDAITNAVLPDRLPLDTPFGQAVGIASFLALGLAAANIASEAGLFRFIGQAARNARNRLSRPVTPLADAGRQA